MKALSSSPDFCMAFAQPCQKKIHDRGPVFLRTTRGKSCLAFWIPKLSLPREWKCVMMDSWPFRVPAGPLLSGAQLADSHHLLGLQAQLVACSRRRPQKTLKPKMKRQHCLGCYNYLNSNPDCLRAALLSGVVWCVGKGDFQP